MKELIKRALKKVRRSCPRLKQTSVVAFLIPGKESLYVSNIVQSTGNLGQRNPTEQKLSALDPDVPRHQLFGNLLVKRAKR